jgi:hypothetical protein
VRSLAAALAAIVVIASAHSCCRVSFLGLDVEVPGDLVGETREDREAIPLGTAQEVAVELGFGAGELAIRPGAAEDLLRGRFLYNVADWAPEITYEEDLLVVEQGRSVAGWSMLTGAARNEWELEFSPAALLDMAVAVGAGDADLDLTGLQLQRLDLDFGAGDFSVRFGSPNGATLSRFDLQAGASDTDVTGIGNASPREMLVQGGVGKMELDFRGEWTASADVTVSAGVGAITILLPQDVAVRLDVEGGLSNVSASGLDVDGGVYVNEAYGGVDRQLSVHVTTGVGSVQLVVLADAD